MKSILRTTTFLAGLCAACLFWAAPVLAGQIEVLPAAGTTGIESAITSAQPGDVVLIRAGQYLGKVKISKIQGASGNPITVRGEAGTLVTNFTVSNSSHLIFDGLEVSGETRGYTIAGCSDVIIRNNHIHDIGNYGVMSIGNSRLTIERNLIERSTNEHGIYISGDGNSDVLIQDNIISKTRINGIHITKEQVRPIVRRNIIIDSGRYPTKEGGAGITCYNAIDPIIENNILINVYGQGITTAAIRGIIRNNLFDSPSWSGILVLNGAQDITIEGNIFRSESTIPYDFRPTVGSGAIHANNNYFMMDQSNVAKNNNARLGQSAWQAAGLDTNSVFTSVSSGSREAFPAEVGGTIMRYSLGADSAAVDNGPNGLKDGSIPPGKGMGKADMGPFGGPGNGWLEKSLRYVMDGFAWHHRKLYVFSPDHADQRLGSQIRELMAHITGVLDRDLEVLQVVGQSPVVLDGEQEFSTSPDALRTEYDVPEDEFTVVLVGKDGTVELRRGQPLAIQELFATIDAMPLRQAEVLARHR